MAMKRGNNAGGSGFYGVLHSDETYEQELKTLLLKKSTKKGKSTSHQSFGSHNHHHFSKRNDYIERVVLETDTLAGLALLYNSSVGEIKKLNHLYTEHDLHARRIIKVPSRGILINLEDPIEVVTCNNSKAGRTQGQGDSLSSSSNTNISVNVTNNFTYEDHNERTEEINANDQMTLYLTNKDNFLQEIREKAENVAANSPILNGSESSDLSIRLPAKKKGSTLKWWHILLPCLSFIIIFPILLFLFQEHIFEHFKNSTVSSSSGGLEVLDHHHNKSLS